MTTYEPADWRPEPGDVAMVAHVAGGSQRMSWDGKRWRSLIHGWSWLAGEASSVRRLLLVDPASTVVLDPDNPDDVEKFSAAAVNHDGGDPAEDALRSLLPAVTPPEPNGLGAVVLPADSSQILQLQDGGWHIVMPVGGDVPTTYKADARDRVLSHGVGCSCGAPDCNGGAS